MNNSEYQQLLAGFRDSAHKMMFSNTTIDTFAGASSPKQIEAVLQILDIEIKTRAQNKRNRLLKQAAFPAIKSVDDFDFSGVQLPAGFNEESLASLTFVDNAENLVLFGPSGRGKTHLAVALGVLATQLGYSVRFYTAADLVYALSKAHKDNTLEKIYSQIERANLIILDEFGYIPFDAEGARLLFQVISKCYEVRSVMFTTNIEFSHWGTILGDDKLAAATIDRIVHHGRLVVFKGANRRMENALMMKGVAKMQDG